MEDEEKVYIRIPVSTKFISTLLVGAVIAFGSYPVVNRLNPSARSDPFTGMDGDKLEDRIEILELEISQCQQRNANHREQQAGELATLKEKTSSNEYLIKRCMRLTGEY